MDHDALKRHQARLIGAHYVEIAKNGPSSLTFDFANEPKPSDSQPQAKAQAQPQPQLEQRRSGGFVRTAYYPGSRRVYTLLSPPSLTARKPSLSNSQPGALVGSDSATENKGAFDFDEDDRPEVSHVQHVVVPGSLNLCRRDTSSVARSTVNRFLSTEL
jgi:hypothetical protein